MKTYEEIQAMLNEAKLSCYKYVDQEAWDRDYETHITTSFHKYILLCNILELEPEPRLASIRNSL